VTVDGTGEFGSHATGDAFFDPIGSLTAAGTTYLSGVALRINGGTKFLNSLIPDMPAVSGNKSKVTSSFRIGDLQFDVTQTLIDDFDSRGRRIGSQLIQTYTITNLGSTIADFDVFRYLDGDLLWNPSLADIGGKLVDSDGTSLYELDFVGNRTSDSTFVGVGAAGGQVPLAARFQIEGYEELKELILSGRPLDNTVLSDIDRNGRSNVASNVALALRNHFLLQPGQFDSYSTTTIFGTGDPAPQSGTISNPTQVVDKPQPITAPSTNTPAAESRQFLLLLLPTIGAEIERASPIGAAGIDLSSDNRNVAKGDSLGSRRHDYTYSNTPQVVDAAFGSDEVDKSVLLANFLDFVEPEMVIVDLGDEPPAKLSVDVSSGPPAAINSAQDKPPMEAANNPTKSGAATNGPTRSVTVLKPPAENADIIGTNDVAAASLSKPITNNWRWLAGGSALLLLAGAAWSSRSKWLHFTRKMRSR
jgi:hypothetical protein